MDLRALLRDKFYTVVLRTYSSERSIAGRRHRGRRVQQPAL